MNLCLAYSKTVSLIMPNSIYSIITLPSSHPSNNPFLLLFLSPGTSLPSRKAQTGSKFSSTETGFLPSSPSRCIPIDTSDENVPSKSNPFAAPSLHSSHGCLGCLVCSDPSLLCFNRCLNPCTMLSLNFFYVPVSINLSIHT